MKPFRIAIIISLLIGTTLNSCKKEEVPTLTTTEITDITGTTALCGGTIIAEGSGTVIARGVCWSTNTNPTIADKKSTDGAGAGTFISNITGLDGGTSYYVRAYATNSVGTGYGMAMFFKTLGQVPAAITLSATNIDATVATLNGSVNANDLSTDVTFEYGATTNYGMTITTSQSPITGNTNTLVSADLTGLTAGKIYHFRVKAINSLGTAYGSDSTFTYTITDLEGIIYNTVTIRDQVWMKENLKTTKYRNGDLIGTTTPSTLDLSSESTPKYQWAYAGNESYVATYGRLYTWFAVTDSRNICPAGWHVPSHSEWLILTDNLGGESVAGGKLKESGTDHWPSPNEGATNETGFTALPGGFRSRTSYGVFTSIGIEGRWWSSTEKSIYPEDGWNLQMHYYYNSAVNSSAWKEVGFSVRCLKN